MKMICITKKTRKNYSWPGMKDETESTYCSADKVVTIYSNRLKNKLEVIIPDEIHMVRIKLSFLETCIEGLARMDDILEMVHYLKDEESKEDLFKMRLYADREDMEDS